MNEIETLKRLIAVLTNQRNFAFDQLAQIEAVLIGEREANANRKDDKPSSFLPPASEEVIPFGANRNDQS